MNKIYYESIETPLTHYGHPVWDIMAYGFLITSLIAFYYSMKD